MTVFIPEQPKPLGVRADVRAVKRYVIAVATAPWAVPLAYALVLGVHVGRDPFEAEPLLPGHLAAVVMMAYWVTVLVALPLWLVLSRRWTISYQIAALSGLMLGVSTALVGGKLQGGYPIWFLLSTSGIGGVLAAIIFRAIIGSQTHSTTD
jgi:hypothetical protein